jgi:hypothetical protein
VNESSIDLDMRQLPESLRRVAFRIGNSELFWPPTASVEAAKWLASRGFAVFGGEIYETGFRQGWGSFTRAWSTEPGWGAHEPWEMYVNRGLIQVVKEVEAHASSNELAVDSDSNRGSYLFFLAFWTESEYRGPRNWMRDSVSIS